MITTGCAGAEVPQDPEGGPPADDWPEGLPPDPLAARGAAEDPGAAGGVDGDGDDGELGPDPSARRTAAGRGPRRASVAARLAARYIEVRAVTMERDGGPGLALRSSASAPWVTTLALAVSVGAVLVMTFGVPPLSPLFLIMVVCGPVYPWLRLEARAQAAWRSQRAR